MDNSCLTTMQTEASVCDGHCWAPPQTKIPHLWLDISFGGIIKDPYFLVGYSTTDARCMLTQERKPYESKTISTFGIPWYI